MAGPAIKADASLPNPSDQNNMAPNIIWIVAEDASPMHLSIYGERNIQTPNIDQFAGEGVLYQNAFVNSPVCSPSRSSMVTGMYATSTGALHHRSQMTSGRGMGNQAFFDSYRLPNEVPFLPEIFQEAGYYTVLAGWSDGELGKSDYNFDWDENVYDGYDWINRDRTRPLFAQIQLRGGKFRNARPLNMVDESQVNLPPYYPTHPVIIADWMEYLNSVLMMDQELGDVLRQIEEEGLADNALVIFITDHGVSHLRSKQYLYEDGIRIPLIMRWPEHIEPGEVRNELVSVLDVSATVVAAAGIELPASLQGNNLFDDTFTGNERVYAASDRLDETVEMIRSVRSDQYKYIRNFHFYMPHLKPNRYKFRKDITQLLIQLNEQGRLNAIQDLFFNQRRPVEELYDIAKDPFELFNLAYEPGYRDVLEDLRDDLEAWMVETGDMGLIPEIEMDIMGARYGSKYAAMRSDELKNHTGNVLNMKRQALMNGHPLPVLKDYLGHDDFSVRFWAATLIRQNLALAVSAREQLIQLLRDPYASVRLAATNALLTIDETQSGLESLARELENENLLVRHYALLVGEDHVEKVRPLREKIHALRNDPYEYTSRVAWRLGDKVDGKTIIR